MAKKFFFRLEPILNLKAHKSREAKEALVLVSNLRRQKEQEIDDKVKYLKKLHKSKSGSVKANELQADYHHKNYVKDEIKKMESEKKQILEIENLRRQKLTEAMKEEKILLKLKEKQKIIHKEVVEKEEILVLDEIGLQQFTKTEHAVR